MSPTKNFPVFDADSHVYEPEALWTEYLEPEYRILARSSFWHEIDPLGIEVNLVNGVPAQSMNSSGINRQAIYKPGMTAADIGDLDPSQPHSINPGAQDAKVRLNDMDSMGIDQALLLPTLFLEYFPVIENPDVAYALSRAYNNWISDFSKVDSNRLIPAAVLPMQSPSFAAREAQRMAGQGFKAVVIRPSFYKGRMPNAPEYAPFWATLEETGMAACVVPSIGTTNPEWTSQGAFVERVASKLRIGHPVAEASALGMDNGIFLSALTFLGHLEDYPKLKLSFLHSGAYWLPLVLEKSETYLWLSPQLVKPVSLEPEEIFHSRQPSLVSFDAWESTVPQLLDLFEGIGSFGSRYPMHDAADAWEAIKMLEDNGTPGGSVEKLMGGNALKFFGLSVS